MNENGQPRTGAAMRRMVNRATVGVLGAAVLATGVVTAGLAYAKGTDQLAATDTASATTGGSSASNGSTDDDTSTSGDDSAAQRSTTGSLTAPTQAPAASSGSSHAQSGGS